jgi:hypothetical protein
LDRIIQIDPKGDDTYRNNAGGTTMLDPVADGVALPDWNILALTGNSVTRLDPDVTPMISNR